jgi:AcrR family transcriptional regulator
MPRKVKFTAVDVIQAAVDLVRKRGLQGLSAPAVAEELGASTMPIYSHFNSMQDLEDEVVKQAWELASNYQRKRFTGDIWIDQAVGYIVFAREEPHLFRCLLDGRNLELKFQMNRRQWEKLGVTLETYNGFKDLDPESILRVRYSRAMLSHGIATAAKIGLNKIFLENDKLLARFLTDASQALLEGYRNAPPIEGEERQLLKERMKNYHGTHSNQDVSK